MLLLKTIEKGDCSPAGKKMHSKGYSAEEIADLVGVSIQRVLEMIKEIESKKHN